MAYETASPVTVTQVLIEANRWAVTGIDIRTPQDGSLDNIFIYAESWTGAGAPGGFRGDINQCPTLEVSGPSSILALCNSAATKYEALVSSYANDVAFYRACRDTFLEYAVAQGTIPSSAAPF
jgi:hypothetical protein